MTFVFSGFPPPPILKKDDKLFFILFLFLDHNWVSFGKNFFFAPQKL